MRWTTLRGIHGICSDEYEENSNETMEKVKRKGKIIYFFIYITLVKQKANKLYKMPRHPKKYPILKNEWGLSTV